MLKKIFNPPKKYLRKDVSPIEFFSALNTANVRYALLRWWHAFPVIPEGEDLDIIVHTDDFPVVEKFLTSRRGGQRCDVYLHDRPGGSSKKKVAYFPLILSNKILDERVLWAGAVYVPSPDAYFASVAFHALYHKGVGGGLFGRTQSDQNEPGDHKYLSELKAAAKNAQIELGKISAESIHKWLQSNHFSPSIDMLGKLADRHSELVPFAGLSSFEELRLSGELVLFVVRQAGGISREFMREFRELLESERIEVLEVYELPKDEVEQTSTLRGGNWGKGPYWKSAGPPHTFVVCYDWYPKTANSEHSLLLNGNISKIKKKARQLYNQKRMPWNRCNPVHSPDNELEVSEFLMAANTKLAVRCKAAQTERKQRSSSAYHVEKVISEGRRSRTDLITYKGQQAIQKTFRTNLESLGENELLARQLFSDRVRMPRVLEYGEGRIIMEYLVNSVPLDPSALNHQEKTEVARTIVQWVHAFWEAGFFYADIAPLNFHRMPDGSLCALDFEFLQPYTGSKPSFDHAFEFKGVPQVSTGYARPRTKTPKSIEFHWNWSAMPFAKYFAPEIEKRLAKPAD